MSPGPCPNSPPAVAHSAADATVTDVDGDQWIDFTGGIGVNNVGHCHPKVVEAVCAQARKLIHTSINVATYESYVAVCKRLCELTPGDFPKQALLCNSGAEAVENAVKVARHATGRTGVIAFEHAFHGRTMLAMSLTSKIMPYKKGFGPFVPDVFRVEFPYCYRCSLDLEPASCGMACLDGLRRLLQSHVDPETVACLIVEPVVGEGGFLTAPDGYFQALQAICREHGIVFIADEIQSGFCRTGPLFAMEHYGVEPDILLTAKSLADGMPLSAVVGRRELMDAPQPGGLGGTYGGNPVACAAALAVMDIVDEEDMRSRAEALGKTLRARLDAMAERFSCIGDVRGLGPMIAMELVHDREAKTPAKDLAARLVAHCDANRLLILSCGQNGNVVRLLMPLTIPEDQLEQGLAIIEQGLEAICAD